MATPTTHYGDIEIRARQDGTGGDLRVSGRITAANFPPPASESGAGREVAVIAGDGRSRVFNVTHTLGVREVTVTVYSGADSSRVLVRCVIESVGKIRITFADPPATGETFTVVIHR